MKLLPFCKVVTDVTSKFKKIKKSDYQPSGRFFIIDQGKEHIAGYTDDESLVNQKFLPIIIFGDHTRVFKYENSPIALGADGAKALLVDHRVAYDKYIFNFLKSINLKDAGYSRHFKFLKEIKIPVPYKGEKPAIDDQIRIAKILSCVDSMIAKRKESLRLQDELLKGIFLEIFGDPVRNEKGWKKEQLGKMSDSRLGKMRDKKFITGKHLYPYLGNSNVKWFEIDINNLLQMDFDEKEREVFSLEYGDLLVCEGGEIGRCSIWKNRTDNCYFQKALHRIRVNDGLKAEFLQYVLWFYAERKGFRNVTSKSTIAHLTGIKLKETRIPIPPLRLQNKFAAIVEKAEYLKTLFRKSLSEFENLYRALSQKAFKGELDISRIPLELEPRNTLTTRMEDSVYSVCSVVEKEKDETLQISDATVR